MTIEYNVLIVLEQPEQLNAHKWIAHYLHFVQVLLQINQTYKFILYNYKPKIVRNHACIRVIQGRRLI